MTKGPKILLLFLAICLCASCGVQRLVPIQEVNVKDSVVVHVRDSVAIRYEVISVELPDESLTVILAPPDSSHLETSLATSDAWVDTVGMLHHSIENKAGALTKEVPVQEHYHSELTEQQHQEVETVTVIQEVEKDLSWWQKLWITSGKILWCIIAGMAVFGLVKLIVKQREGLL